MFQSGAYEHKSCVIYCDPGEKCGLALPINRVRLRIPKGYVLTESEEVGNFLLLHKKFLVR